MKNRSSDAGNAVRRPIGRRHGESRPAATIIELLVAVAIITMLVALLAPALLHAREEGRRLSCGNRTRQVGFSLLGYLDTHGRFPSNEPVRWGVDVLPYLEQRALAEGYDRGRAPWDLENRTTVARSLDVFLCPAGSSPAPP